jgi:hemoglobin
MLPGFAGTGEVLPSALRIWSFLVQYLQPIRMPRSAQGRPHRRGDPLRHRIEEFANMARSIFERYGGFARISQIVSSFYDRMVESPITRPFFAKTDMKRLIDHQTKFIASLMGGPVSYTHEHIERVHAHLGITTAAFNESMELLNETLDDFEFDEDDIQQVGDEMMSYKNFVVTKR